MRGCRLAMYIILVEASLGKPETWEMLDPDTIDRVTWKRKFVERFLSLEMLSLR